MTSQFQIILLICINELLSENFISKRLINQYINLMSACYFSNTLIKPKIEAD